MQNQTYRLINNLSNTDNHSKRLKELFESSEEVLIASPFLMGDFTDFLSEINMSQLQKIHLITTLLPNSFEQIKKIGSLLSIVDFPEIKEKRVACEISINNKLHGKVYIFKKSKTSFAAIISSANFTDSVDIPDNLTP